MGGKSQPDFTQLAAAQGEQSRESLRDQTYANRPTQYSPFGYTNWTNTQVIDPATGKPTTQWTQTTGLTPELQDILNKQIAIQGGRTDVAGMLTGRMGNEFGQQMDWSGLSPMGLNPAQQMTLPEGDIGNPYDTRMAAENAVYNQAMSRLQPMYDSKRQALEIKLRNQGVGPQDEAWQAQMGQLGQQETDAVNQALWSASGAGRQEAGQMWGQMMGQNQNMFNQALQANRQNYGQAMQGSQYANQLRQQQMTEAMQQRGFSLNEINALLSGQQVGMPSMPSFTQAGQATPPPTYQAGVDQASAENAASPWAGLANLAGQGMMAYGMYAASDRRLKRNIRRTGTFRGYPWYEFDYIWGEPGSGVMADEAPEYAVEMPSGYMAVDYGRLLGGD